MEQGSQQANREVKEGERGRERERERGREREREKERAEFTHLLLLVLKHS